MMQTFCVALVNDKWCAESAISGLVSIFGKSAADIPLESLRSITHLKSVVQKRWDRSVREGKYIGRDFQDMPEYAEIITYQVETNPVDCSELGQLAQQELVRRGFDE